MGSNILNFTLIIRLSFEKNYHLENCILEFIFFDPYSLMIKQPLLWLLNFEKLLSWPSHVKSPILEYFYHCTTFNPFFEMLKIFSCILDQNCGPDG